MSHVKIVCPGPKVEGSFIQYPDAKLLLVRDDGTEEDISDHVARITWDLKAGDIAKATVEFIGTEIDAVGLLETPADKCLAYDEAEMRKRRALALVEITPFWRPLLYVGRYESDAWPAAHEVTREHLDAMVAAFHAPVPIERKFEDRQPAAGWCDRIEVRESDGKVTLWARMHLTAVADDDSGPLVPTACWQTNGWYTTGPRLVSILLSNEPLFPAGVDPAAARALGEVYV